MRCRSLEPHKDRKGNKVGRRFSPSSTAVNTLKAQLRRLLRRRNLSLERKTPLRGASALEASMRVNEQAHSLWAPAGLPQLARRSSVIR